MSAPAGIDVSRHQGAITWPRVAAAGVDFAICKATEGRTYRDPRWARNRDGARAAGLIVGAYHFARPGTSAPGVQLAWHLEQARPAAGDIVPVLDLEAHDGLSSAALTRWALDWLTAAEDELGSTPMLYTGPSFARDRLTGDRALARFPLWLAHYTSAAAPSTPAPWPSWTIWQHTDRGRVAGISGDVDLNRRSSLPLPLHHPNQELTVDQIKQLREDIAQVRADVWIALDYAKRAAEASAKGLTLSQEDYRAQLIDLHEARKARGEG